MQNDWLQENDKNLTAIQTSFVLRCWLNEDGRVRARLVDVRTGNTYPLAGLDRLPEIVQGLLEPLVSGKKNGGAS